MGNMMQVIRVGERELSLGLSGDLSNNAIRAGDAGFVNNVAGKTASRSGVRNPGAAFNAGAAGSNTIVQHLPDNGRVESELAAFIQAHTGGSNSPYQWSEVQLGKVQPPAPSPNAGLGTITPAPNGCVTAQCAAGVLPLRDPLRDAADVRNDVAVMSEMVGRVAGIVGSTATAAAVQPGPHQPLATKVAVTATGVGLAADFVEQVAGPDVGKGVNDFFLNIAQKQIDNKLPLVAPITNEVRALWVQSGMDKPFEAWANEQWSVVVKQLESSK